MLKNVFSKDILISILNSKILLKHFTSLSPKGRAIFSISTNDNSVFLFFNSFSLINPLVCKINTGLENVIFTSISPSLEQIAIISDSSNVSILSLKPLLDYDSSSHINSCITKTYFPASDLNLSNFSAAHFYPNVSFKAITKNQILNVFWWKLPGTFMNLIIVEKDGFIIAHLYDFPIKQKEFSLNELCNINEEIKSSAFRQNNNEVNLVVSTNSHLILFNITQNSKNELEIEKTVLDIDLKQNNSINMQIINNDNGNWFLAIYQNDLIFIDSNMKIVNRYSLTDPKSSLNESIFEGFCITKHFLFQIISGNLYVKFNHAFNELKKQNSQDLNAKSDYISQKFCIEKDCHQIYLIDYERDSIAVMTKTACEIIDFNQNPELLVLALIKENKIEESMLFSSNFNLNFQSFLNQSCCELISENHIFTALKIMCENSTSIKQSMKELITHGFDRASLDILLRQNIENKQTILNLLIQKIYQKNKLFPLFEKLYSSINFDDENDELKSPKSFHFPSPEEFAKSGLLKELKNNETSFIDLFPPALIFHLEMNFKIETESLTVFKEASVLDIPQNKSGFSPEFSLFLTMLSHVLPTKEESLPYPISSQINTFSDAQQSKVYISKNTLFIGNKEIMKEVDSFVLFDNYLFVLLTNHSIFFSKTDKIEFILLDISPAIYICSSYKYLAILTIAGPIFYYQPEKDSFSTQTNKIYQSSDFQVFEGSFVDVCICNDKIFGLNDEGQVIDITNEENIFYNYQFIREILSSKTSLICRTLTSDLIIISLTKDNDNITSIHVDFKVEKAKSGEKAIIAGEGKIMIIDDSNNIEYKDYSRRIGTLLDITIENDTILLAGSSANPVRLLPQERFHHNYKREFLSFTNFQKIYKYFNESILFGLFKDELSILYLSVLYKKWDFLKGEIHPIIHLLDELPLDHSIETVHALISRNLLKNIDSEILQKHIFKKKYTNQCLIKYPNDIKLIPQKYYLNLIPERKIVEKGEIAQKMLQKCGNQSVFISSNQLNKKELVAFSCGHHIERNELLRFVQKNSQQQNKQYIKEVYKFYCLQTIPMQCPKCLETELQNSGLL